ncbi:MAG: tRNA pseudouridine(38-40) synthase TruA [Clostridia bacterium]|nr:tRNA pseudouridine(38-40) synthase TruA [Clostridia bacterium]
MLYLSYNGSNYHGWQIQPNALTVQEEFENALLKLLGKPAKVTACSRTDTGVHAREFCCHLDIEDNIPHSAFSRGLNALLPPDIAVTDVKDVPSDFHARYNCKGKTYVYRILNSNKKDAFLSPFTWQIERQLDIEKMNELCKNLIGTHDFFAFSASGRTVDDTVRTITDCFVEKQGDIITLSVTGNGFLYNMVRIIVGTAVDVSDGKLPADIPFAAFETKKRESVGMTAPAQGLILEKVYY